MTSLLETFMSSQWNGWWWLNTDHWRTEDYQNHWWAFDELLWNISWKYSTLVYACMCVCVFACMCVLACTWPIKTIIIEQYTLSFARLIHLNNTAGLYNYCITWWSFRVHEKYHSYMSITNSYNQPTTTNIPAIHQGMTIWSFHCSPLHLWLASIALEKQDYLYKNTLWAKLWWYLNVYQCEIKGITMMYALNMQVTMFVLHCKLIKSQ